MNDVKEVERKLDVLRAYGILSDHEVERRYEIGFVVNPIAGMGGRVGLKGTDGKYEEAVKRGAKPVSPIRAIEFLVSLKKLIRVRIITAGGLMGEAEARASGYGPVVKVDAGEKTSGEDTKKAVRAMLDADMIVFVGGDGTARDVYEVVEDQIPILGVPAGVKMYSGVFAVNPFAAARVTADFIRGRAEVELREVADVDEEKIANGFELKIYGYAKVPVSEDMVQEMKRGGWRWKLSTPLIHFDPGVAYILGPGGTIVSIAKSMGIDKTPLGVDVVYNGEVIRKDCGERELIDVVREMRRRGVDVKIIVTPIGGNGFIFGRGNLQISPEVIRAVGVDNIIVVSSYSKLRNLRHLRVDTGDEEVDEMFRKRGADVITETGVVGMEVR